MPGFLLGAALTGLVCALLARHAQRRNRAQTVALTKALHDEIACTAALGRKVAENTIRSVT